MIPSPRVVRVAVRVVRYVPLPLARALAAAGGTIAWAILTRRRRILMENLAHTATDEPPARRRLLTRRTFRNFAAAAIDLLRLPSLSHDDVLKLCLIRNREYLDEARKLGKGVVVVTAHLGPYELGGAWAAAAGYPVHSMVEDLDPETLAALATYRSATGMKLISMKQGVRAVFRLLQDERVVLLVADRAIGDGRGAVELPFAAGRRPVPTGPATFAIGAGAPIVTGHIALNPDRQPRYLIEFEPPIFAEGRGDSERLRLTRLVTDRLAAAVRKYPDQWYVFQPHWLPPVS